MGLHCFARQTAWPIRSPSSKILANQEWSDHDGVALSLLFWNFIASHPLEGSEEALWSPAVI